MRLAYGSECEMVKRSDGEGHIRFKDRLASFAELSGDPFDETTDEAFAEWMSLVNEGLAAVGRPRVSAEAEFNSDSMREMFDAAFTPEEAAAAVIDSRWNSG